MKNVKLAQPLPESHWIPLASPMSFGFAPASSNTPTPLKSQQATAICNGVTRYPFSFGSAPSCNSLVNKQLFSVLVLWEVPANESKIADGSKNPAQDKVYCIVLQSILYKKVDNGSLKAQGLTVLRAPITDLYL